MLGRCPKGDWIVVYVNVLLKGYSTTVSFYSHHFSHRLCSIVAQTVGDAVDSNAFLKQCWITAGSTESHEKRSMRIAVKSELGNGCLVSKAATLCCTSRLRYLHLRLRIIPASIGCTAAVLFPLFFTLVLFTPDASPYLLETVYGENWETTCAP